MANLKEIRNRISSVSSTMQITSAMKMVSAAKLKKAQDAITAMRPYSNKLTEILQSLSSSIDSDNKYAQKRKVKKVLIVSITSNRGLCGGFNSNIFKKSTELANSVYNDTDVSFVAIGKKGNDFLQKSYNVESNHIDILPKIVNEIGIINIGGKSQSVYDFAKKYNKSLKKAKLDKNSKLPLNQTMNLSKLKRFLKW